LLKASTAALAKLEVDRNWPGHLLDGQVAGDPVGDVIGGFDPGRDERDGG
jgi:hypothetical protein